MNQTLNHIEQRIIARIDRLFNYPQERRKFKKVHGYDLNLEAPQSLNEKIVWKKIFDRSPLLPNVADKLLMKDYLADKLGRDVAATMTIPTLWQSDQPTEIPYDRLPKQFVIKSNHGSGNNFLVWDKDQVDRKAVVRMCRDWLRDGYGVRAHEWAYTQIRKKIFIETLLRNKEGQVPEDYKFSMIHGQCAFIQVDRDRYGDFERSLYDPEWQYLDVKWKRELGKPVPKPKNLTLMLEIAQILSADFDYVRVDFYNLDGEIYVGELTHYPARGRGKFTPKSFDFEIGKLWEIAPKIPG